MELNELKQILEREFEVSLYARTIDGTHILTDFGKPYLDIRWSDNSNGYYVFCAPDERSLPTLMYSGWQRWSLDKLKNEMSVYFKRKQQLSLF